MGIQYGPDLDKLAKELAGKPRKPKGLMLALALLAATVTVAGERGTIDDGPDPFAPALKGQTISLLAEPHSGVIPVVGVQMFSGCGPKEEARCQAACNESAMINGRVPLPAACSISWLVVGVIQASVDCGCRSWEPIVVPTGPRPCDLCGTGQFGQ